MSNIGFKFLGEKREGSFHMFPGGQAYLCSVILLGRFLLVCSCMCLLVGKSTSVIPVFPVRLVYLFSDCMYYKTYSLTPLHDK